MSFRFRAWIALAALTVVIIIVASTSWFGTSQLGGAIAESDLKPSGLPVASLRAVLRFSDPPTDEEFLRTSVFPQPLVPVGSTSPEENRQLAALLVAYDVAARHGDRDAVEPLVSFLADHPRSAWEPALQVNLGAIYRRKGHFSKALATWQD